MPCVCAHPAAGTANGSACRCRPARRQQRPQRGQRTWRREDGRGGGRICATIRRVETERQPLCLPFLSFLPFACLLLLLLLWLFLRVSPGRPNRRCAAAKHATHSSSSSSTGTEAMDRHTRTKRRRGKRAETDGVGVAARSHCARRWPTRRSLVCRRWLTADLRLPVRGAHRASRPNGLPTAHPLPIGVLHGL
jgi:hypothetical protein